MDEINEMSSSELINQIKKLEKNALISKEKNDDLKATLFINRNLLDDLLESKLKTMSLELQTPIKEMIKKMHALEETNTHLFEQNVKIYEQLLSSSQAIETGKKNGRFDVKELENKNTQLTAMYNEKEKFITNIRDTLKGLQSKKPPGVAVQEKHILDPTQQTLLMHNELLTNKMAIKKLNKKMSEEIARRDPLLAYNRQVKQKNEQLKSVLRSIISNNMCLTEKSEGVFKALDMEKIKSVLENEIAEPTAAQLKLNKDEAKKADTSLNFALKPPEPELSVASSIGLPLPAKNDLSKSHDRIKPLIPMLDFTKIKGRPDLKKMDRVSTGDINIPKLDKRKVGASIIQNTQNNNIGSNTTPNKKTVQLARSTQGKK